MNTPDTVSVCRQVLARIASLALLASSQALAGPADLVISEIMYNPASAENDWEWVELYNAGSDPVNLSGFVLDDINSVALSAANIAGGTVPPGGTALLYNADDLNEADFVAAWGTGINLVPVTEWDALSLNNGGDTIGLWADFASYAGDNSLQTNALISLAYDDSAPWPSDDGAGSIFLTDLSADPDSGASWALSTGGVPSPLGDNAYQSAAAGGNSGSDVASAGGFLLPPPPPMPSPDAVVATIPQIQGAAHTSPLLGELVVTTGVVTATDSNGYYLQDPAGDGDIATSDAIFLFTGGAPGVDVGDELQVEGTVSEFTPGGPSTGNLSTTQLSGSRLIELRSTGNVLPAPVIIGAGGRVPPSRNIDDDAFTSFEPDTDGIDFFESLEAMRVTGQDLVAVAPTNRFGEIFAVANQGADATGKSSRGTLNIARFDFNPEKIQIDEDSGVFNFDFPAVQVGDLLGDVTGVLGYSFGNFEILPTEDFTDGILPAGLVPESSPLSGDRRTLSIASYNVLNLDPNDRDGDEDIADGRFDALAAQIVNALSGPDILGLQEIQDNSGSVDDGTVAADETLQRLVDAILAAGGPAYAFIDNSFITDNASGGQPGGNIRTAFLYRPDRVALVPGSVKTIGSQDPGEAFEGARLPLVATFEFRGAEITVVNNHFSSKGGSAPILGVEQDFAVRQEDVTVNGSLDERRVQSRAVRGFAFRELLRSGYRANLVVLGDLNEFEFISPVFGLELIGLRNLTRQLPPDERYSFIFQGNSQALDHVLVSPSLRRSAKLDVVHVNSEFPETDERASDHDPVLVTIRPRR